MWELDHKETWAPKNWSLWTAVLEKLLRVSWTARRSNQSILKEISPEYSLEGLMLSWNSNTLATWCEELIHWKRPSCWERLKAGGEGDNRGWDGWMESPTQRTRVWTSSRRRWWTGKPGMLQSMGLQRVRRDWLNWTELPNDPRLNFFSWTVGHVFLCALHNADANPEVLCSDSEL